MSLIQDQVTQSDASIPWKLDSLLYWTLKINGLPAPLLEKGRGWVVWLYVLRLRMS